MRTLKRAGVLRCWNLAFCRWVDGGYRLLPDSEIDGPLREWIREEFIRVNKREIKAWEETDKAKEKPTTRKVTNALIGNVLGAMRSIVRVPFDTAPPCWFDSAEIREPSGLLPMRNGILELKSGELIPATPAFFTFNALPYDYEPWPATPTVWLKFLSELWPGDQQSINCLQEWFGYLLTPDTRQQKILFLYGPKRSGKSTILRILNGIIGSGNVVGPTLGSLATNFGLWPLLGKSVASVSDARLSGRSDSATITERLLSISGEDVLTIDRKHLAPVTQKLSTRFVLASNELPRLGDASGALAGRFIILKLVKTFFAKEDNGLTHRLLDERPGILDWSIAGWKRLQSRGHFVQPASASEVMRDMEDLNSPVGEFIREFCILGPGERIKKGELYTAWKRWCEQHGRRQPGTESNFGRDLCAAVSDLKTIRRKQNSERWREYDGIRLRTESDTDDPHGPVGSIGSTGLTIAASLEVQLNSKNRDAMESPVDPVAPVDRPAWKQFETFFPIQERAGWNWPQVVRWLNEKHAAGLTDKTGFYDVPIRLRGVAFEHLESKCPKLKCPRDPP